MKTSLIAAVLSIGLAGAAGATPPVDDDKMNLPLEGSATAARITAIPDNAQLQREYPRIPLMMDMRGRAAVDCAVGTDGRLSDCRVAQESPSGLGFGAAAIRMAAYFTVQPATLNGQPVASRLTLPISFQLDSSNRSLPAETIAQPSSPESLVLAKEVLTLERVEPEFRRRLAEGLKGLTTYVVAGGDAAAGERVEDAYRRASEDIVNEELDHRARLIATTMTADQLRSTLVYLKTPAGAAFLAAGARIDDPGHPDFWRRVTERARTYLCANAGCPGQPDQASAP